MPSNRVSTLEIDTPLLEIADVLYALPLGEFTSTRDAQAKAVAAGPAGDRALAARIKALKKPSTAAWVVNHLVRSDSDQVAEILTIGEGLRTAQQVMDGEELRALTRQRRQLTAAVTTRARGLANDYGQRVTEAVGEQVEATITAALLDQSAAAAFRTGMLVQTLSAIGFTETDAAAAVALTESLGNLPVSRSPDPPRPDLHVVPDLDADTLERARREEALAAAQQQLLSAKAQQGAAEERHAQWQAQALQNASKMEEVRRELIELETGQERIDDELVAAQALLIEMESQVATARLERETAAAALMTE